MYDSLLAKIIAWAPARDEAAARLADALDHTDLAGIHTNERWLGRILRSQVFLEVRHSVALLDRRPAEFSQPIEATPAAVVLAALAASGSGRVPPAVAGGGSPWEVSDGFQPSLPAAIELTLSAGGRTHRVRLMLEGGEPCAAVLLAGAEKSAPPQGGARQGRRRG